MSARKLVPASHVEVWSFDGGLSPRTAVAAGLARSQRSVGPSRAAWDALAVRSAVRAVAGPGRVLRPELEVVGSEPGSGGSGDGLVSGVEVAAVDDIACAGGLTAPFCRATCRGSGLRPDTTAATQHARRPRRPPTVPARRGTARRSRHPPSRRPSARRGHPRCPAPRQEASQRLPGTEHPPQRSSNPTRLATSVVTEIIALHSGGDKGVQGRTAHASVEKILYHDYSGNCDSPHGDR